MESETRLRAIIEHAIDGIITINDRGIIESVNPAVLSLFAYKTEEELVGQNIGVLMPEPDHSQHDAYIGRYKKTREAKIIGIGREVIGLKKNGKTFPFRLAISEIQLENRRVFTGFIHDLTKEKEAQQHAQRLEHSLQLLHDITANQYASFEEKVRSVLQLGCELFDLPMGVLTEIKEDKYSILSIVDNSTQHINHGKKTVTFSLEGTFDELTIKEDYPFCVKNITKSQWKDKLCSDEGNWGFYFGIRIKVNEEVCGVLRFLDTESHDSFSPISNQEILKLMAQWLSSEIARKTHRQTLEKQVRDRTKELVKSLEKEKELNELKSQFMSIASHEFRTPLSTILSSVSLLSHYNTEEHKFKHNKHIRRVQSMVKNLTTILNDFLSLSRLQEKEIKTEPEFFDIIQFSRSVIEDMQTVAKDKQKLTYQHIGKVENIETDPHILKNILINLLSNAIKYSKEKTTINLITQLIGNQLIIQIIDKGIGIPKEEQSFLFDRFFRASNVENEQGTGLGLNIVKHYMDLLSGTISFTSKLGEGSTFILKIPQMWVTR
jgi:PAS domain S-box-containing protein